MQNTWLTFNSLSTAISGTRGNTQAAIGLVKDNLYVGEKVEWVATAAINDFGNWRDGCVVLTDQRIFAAYCDETLQQTYGNMIARIPVPRISEFQGGGDVTSFEIQGLPIQAIALAPKHLHDLKDFLTNTDQASQLASAAASVSEDPKESLMKARELADLGLISEAEYDAKKQEILGRL